MTFDLVFPSAFGLIVGSLLSLLFNIYSQPTTSKFIYSIFGIDSDLLIKMIVLFLITSGIAGLAGLSVLIRDFDYPIQNPYKFLTELCVASFFPATLLFVMTHLRQQAFTGYTVLEFLLLAAKFGILHVLLQFSGVYSSVFPTGRT